MTTNWPPNRAQRRAAERAREQAELISDIDGLPVGGSIVVANSEPMVMYLAALIRKRLPEPVAAATFILNAPTLAEERAHLAGLEAWPVLRPLGVYLRRARESQRKALAFVQEAAASEPPFVSHPVGPIAHDDPGVKKAPPVFGDLVGKTLTAISVRDDEEEITFELDTGERFRLFHDQNCCEYVYVEDVCGDLTDLVGSLVLQAEESSNSDDPPLSSGDESHTWTFYKLATIKGSVTIRWYGSSNGYYSESVSFERLE